jgi:hypothetical protein
MEHLVEKGVVLGGKSFTDQLEFKARRQKHFANVVGRSLRLALRDELLELEMGRMKVDPSGWQSERHLAFRRERR